MHNHPHMLKRFVAAGIACGLTLIVVFTACSCQRGYSAPIASISLGSTASEVNTLIVIAQDHGYFTENGLNVIHKIYPSGVAAIDGLLNHNVELATGSEFAFAGEVLMQQDISTIAAINRSSIEYLVGRIDRGIEDIADLKGTTIGVPLGSRPEFALDRFLYFRGIDASQGTLVDVPVNRSVEALVNGTVDAVAAWQPYIDRIKEQMGRQVVSWSVQEDQPSYTLVMCRGEWTAENGDVIVRFLKSLVQAETYVADNPEAARAFVQEELHYDADYMASVWPDYRFSVMLDQPLVVAMEDQARWIIGRDPAAEKQTPNFVDYIYTDGLEVVEPAAVSIIR
jgi:NitT/TauT family transport system substrate-binding protein